jgi:HEAT repeat protein
MGRNKVCFILIMLFMAAWTIPSVLGADKDDKDVKDSKDAKEVVTKEDIKDLCGQLKSNNENTRFDAASKLESVADVSAAQDLLESFANESSSAVKMRCRSALVNIGYKVLPVMIKNLSENRSTMRSAAVQIIGLVGDKRNIPALDKLKKDPSANVRSDVADAIGMLEMRVMNSVDEKESAPAEENKAQDQEEAKPVPHTPLPKLIQNFGSKDPKITKTAIDEMVARGEEMLPTLRDLIQKRQAIPNVIEVLSQMKNPATIDDLTPFLSDPNKPIRLAALKALVNIGGEPVEPSMAKMLKDRDPEIKALALNTLCDIGGDKAIAELTALVKTGDKDTRDKAGNALMKQGNPGIGPVLTILRTPGTPSDTRVALFNMFKKNPESIVNVMDMLQESKSPEDVLVREFLALLDPVASEKIMLKLLDMRDSSYILPIVMNQVGKNKMKKGIPQLVRFLDSDKVKIRLAAINALGDIGSKLAKDPLVKMMKISQPEDVRTAAAKALSKLTTDDKEE